MVYGKKDQAKLRLMIYLSRQWPERVSQQKISTDMAMSISAIELLSVDLRCAGLIGSQKGFGGGLMLEKPASEITILEILNSRKKPLGVEDECLKLFNARLGTYLANMRLSDISDS